ncbi:MAG: acyl-CoA/acyl-ACP dehydrogenase [Betaproteobacteria bacterium]|nr:acyl-CoA/acyl-ACP dehydrogenase [Betaproteobacteria bacterium]
MHPLAQDLRCTDEQAMLLESASAFCRERSPVARVRALLGTHPGHDPAVWDEIIGLGWCGIAVPEAHGGSGLDLAHVAAVTEPMGRHLLATPFVSSQLAIQGLLAGGDAALQAEWLPRLSQGLPATVALWEAEGSWALLAPGCGARREAGGVVLDGVKTLVPDAGVADLLLASVLVDGEPAVAVIPSSALPPGARRPEVVIDETRRVFRVDLHGVRLPAGSLITGAPALAALRAVRDAGLLLACAEATGGLAAVLALTVDYLNLRSAFGRKIGSYQSLKHTCAEILVGLERARSHLWHAATLLAEGADAEVALRMAKVEAGDSFVFAGDRAVQFHGGFGFTWECDAQLYLRRALWLQYAFGDAAHHRRRLADRLLAPAEPLAA